MLISFLFVFHTPTNYLGSNYETSFNEYILTSVPSPLKKLSTWARSLSDSAPPLSGLKLCISESDDAVYIESLTMILVWCVGWFQSTPSSDDSLGGAELSPIELNRDRILMLTDILCANEEKKWKDLPLDRLRWGNRLFSYKLKKNLKRTLNLSEALILLALNATSIKNPHFHQSGFSYFRHTLSISINIESEMELGGSLVQLHSCVSFG